MIFPPDLPPNHHFISLHQLHGREAAKGGRWFIMLKHAPNPEYVGAQATYGRGLANEIDTALAQALTSITEQLSRPAHLAYQRAQAELKQIELGDFLI